MERGKYIVRLLVILVLGLFIHLMFNISGVDGISKDVIVAMGGIITTVSVLFWARLDVELEGISDRVRRKGYGSFFIRKIEGIQRDALIHLLISIVLLVATAFVPTLYIGSVTMVIYTIIYAASIYIGM